MPDTTSTPTPSALVQASGFLMGLWKSGHLPPEEVERRAQGAQRLKEAFSSIPWHTSRAERDPEYWNTLYASQVNW